MPNQIQFDAVPVLPILTEVFMVHISGKFWNETVKWAMIVSFASHLINNSQSSFQFLFNAVQL